MSDTFSSFCSRQWLDYCDETSSFGSTTLSKEEYIKQYNSSLLKKYAEHVEKKNEPIK